MKRKVYRKPTAEVVKFEEQCQLLAGSVETTRDGYGDAEEDNWE